MAGLIDGEGSIGIVKFRRSYTLRVMVTGTDPRLADWILTRFGGDVQWKHERPERWKPEFMWRVQWKRAHALVELLEPLLVVKRDQAWVGITLAAVKTVCENNRRGRRVSRWRPYTAEEEKGFDFLREYMRRLNARGVADADAEGFLQRTAAGMAA
jgi:hypothetical protein